MSDLHRFVYRMSATRLKLSFLIALILVATTLFTALCVGLTCLVDKNEDFTEGFTILAPTNVGSVVLLLLLLRFAPVKDLRDR